MIADHFLHFPALRHYVRAANCAMKDPDADWAEEMGEREHHCTIQEHTRPVSWMVSGSPTPVDTLRRRKIGALTSSTKLVAARELPHACEQLGEASCEERHADDNVGRRDTVRAHVVEREHECGRRKREQAAVNDRLSDLTRLGGKGARTGHLGCQYRWGAVCG